MGDFLYACVQLVHNLGAAAVVGSPAAAWWLAQDNIVAQRKIAWLILYAWAIQVASGAGFGATTYYLKHELPELTSVGLFALVVKVSCALISFCLVAFYLRAGQSWSMRGRARLWQGLFIWGLAALISAAFLRWYA